MSCSRVGSNIDTPTSRSSNTIWEIPLQTLSEQSPFLSPSKEGEDLYLNLAVLATAVSTALIWEENRTQLPIYYVSQTFQGAEAKYPRIEKIAFALIVASRKLHPYFQANPILVMMDQPIKKFMNKPKVAGKMIQWAIELRQF